MTDHLDAEVLREIRELMGDDFELLLEAYQSDADASMAAIQSAVAAADAPTLRHYTHSLKGSCSNIGAVSLANLCARLEQRAKADDLTEIESLIDCVIGEFDAVARDVDALRP